MSPILSSILNTAAVMIYLAVSAGCLFAASLGARSRQLPAHWRLWAVIGIAFIGFAALRWTGIERELGDALRGYLVSEGSYDERRALQRPLAAGLVAVVGVVIALGLMRQWRLARGRRDLALIAGQAGLFAMAALLGMRLVSLHAVDKLLYGPLKLNWVIDIGASLTVLAAALFYMRLIRQRP